jgi:hypothetical protein
MREFKMQVTMMSNLKRFMEQSTLANQPITPAIVDYLKSKNLRFIEIKDSNLSQEYCFHLFL